MKTSSDYTQLCRLLGELPGVGSNAAERMAEWLIHHGPRTELEVVLNGINDAGVCPGCNRLMSRSGCSGCGQADPDSSAFLICATEKDLRAINDTTEFAGPVFVLHGELSPSRNIGPAQLQLDKLAIRINEIDPPRVAIAVSSSVEGRATAEFIFRKTGRSGHSGSVEEVIEWLRSRD